jgi:hypothetical protein
MLYPSNYWTILALLPCIVTAQVDLPVLSLLPSIIAALVDAPDYLSPNCETQVEIINGGLDCKLVSDCKGHVSDLHRACAVLVEAARRQELHCLAFPDSPRHFACNLS